MIRTILIFFSTVMFSGAAMAQVWYHDESKAWNEEQEERFSQWVKTSVDADFISKPGTFYHRLKVDCADFQYLLRIIFSMQNDLEFAINDPGTPLSTRGGGVISSKSQRWNSIRDPSERARKFSQYIFAITSTQTLPADTVLVPMTRRFLRAGTLLLGDLKRGHSMVIKNFRPSGVPILLYGNLPADEHIYTAYNFPDSQSYFPMGPISVAKGGGFRRFRWPSDLKKDPRYISFSSEDQILIGQTIKTFFESAQEVVRIQPITPDEKINYLIDDLCSQVRVRVNTITDATNFLKSHSNRPLTYAEDDRFSTYKRDENIVVLINKLITGYSVVESSLTPSTRSRYRNTLYPQGVETDECFVDWASDCMEPLGWIIDRFKSKAISSHARDSLMLRWGHRNSALCLQPQRH